MTTKTRGPGPTSIDSMSVADVNAAYDDAKALVAEFRARLPGLANLTADQRKSTEGRVRGDDERKALHSALDVADAFPALFTALAGKDNGKDPDKLETDLIRARIDRAVVLGKVAALFTEFSREVADTALQQGALAKPVASAVYQITKTQSAFDPGVASKGAAAIDYYASLGKAAAAGRKRNKTGK